MHAATSGRRIANGDSPAAFGFESGCAGHESAAADDAVLRGLVRPAKSQGALTHSMCRSTALRAEFYREHAQVPVLVVPQLTTSASWGLLSRRLAALMPYALGTSG